MVIRGEASIDNIKKGSLMGALFNGGEEGIRTLDGVSTILP